MSQFKRRDFLKMSAGLAAGVPLLAHGQAKPAAFAYRPEKGARLRVLRWKRFVQGDEDKWAENTKKYTQATGVEVRIDAEGWEDVRPKAAVAANVGSGPDIIIGNTRLSSVGRPTGPTGKFACWMSGSISLTLGSVAFLVA